MKKGRQTRFSPESEAVRRDGALCVTFVNTQAGRTGPGRRPIVTYADLLAWARETGVLAAAAAARLEQVAAERPAGARDALRRALRWRDRLQRILLALASQGSPDPADVEALNAELVLSARRLVPAGSGYAWAWDEPGDDDLGRMLWLVVLSAAELLCSKYHRQVRRCAGKDCELLFVDRSPGRRRKWCSRESCGDRARSGRRYHGTIKPLIQEARQRRARRPSPMTSASSPSGPDLAQPR